MPSMVEVWEKAAAFATRWLSVGVLIVGILGRAAAAAAAASAGRLGSSRSTSAGRLPPMGQQLLDSAVQLRGQSGEHVLQAGPRLVPVQLGRLQQAHHHRRTFSGQLAADEEPVAPVMHSCA